MTQNNKPETDNAMCLVRRDVLERLINRHITITAQQANSHMATAGLLTTTLREADEDLLHAKQALANPVQGWRTDHVQQLEEYLASFIRIATNNRINPEWYPDSVFNEYVEHAKKLLPQPPQGDL